jgi:nucleoside-diphosphate-sugar epimerase
MRYVVTGAAGFIGYHLVEELLEHGHDTIAVDCFTDYYDPALKEENAVALNVERVDLAVGAITELLRGADGVFHLAGQPGVRSSGETTSRYTFGATSSPASASLRLLRRQTRAWCSLPLSSGYGDAESFPTAEDARPLPISPYGVTKLACEHLARAYGRSAGLDVVVLRYFTVYGPRQRPDMAFARLMSALAQGRLSYGDGSQSRSFTYVSDAVRATTAAMERAPAGAVYNIGGGTEATMGQAIKLAERIACAPLELMPRPAASGDARRTAADTSRVLRSSTGRGSWSCRSSAGWRLSGSGCRGAWRPYGRAARSRCNRGGRWSLEWVFFGPWAA